MRFLDFFRQAKKSGTLTHDRKATAEARPARYFNHPLIEAAKAGDTRTVQIILEKGTDVNAVDLNGWTALIHASKKGYLPIVKALLAAGAEPNSIIIETGGTALLAAVPEGHSAVVAELLKSGADPNAAFKAEIDGRSAAVLAAEFGHWDIVRLLKQAGAKMTHNGTRIVLNSE